jgi:hypothetical protein
MPARARWFGYSRADLNAEDQTGYVWAFLDEARDPSLVTPGALVVAGDEEAPAVAVVVDLVEHTNGTIVHLDVLPGAVDRYIALARRVEVLARSRTQTQHATSHRQPTRSPAKWTYASRTGCRQ